MAKAGRLPAIRFGRALMIKEKDLALVADRKPGRPPLTDEEKAERVEKQTAEKDASSLPSEPLAKTKPKAGAKKSAVKKQRRSNK